MVMIRSFPAIDEHLDTLATQLPVRPSLFACDEFLNRTRNSGAWDRVLARPQRGPTAMRADPDEGQWITPDHSDHPFGGSSAAQPNAASARRAALRMASHLRSFR